MVVGEQRENILPRDSKTRKSPHTLFGGRKLMIFKAIS